LKEREREREKKREREREREKERERERNQECVISHFNAIQYLSQKQKHEKFHQLI
jgi:hypothetical protein